jgi:hypothetical protein
MAKRMALMRVREAVGIGEDGAAVNGSYEGLGRSSMDFEWLGYRRI